MTTREFYENIINSNTNEEMVVKAKELLASLDKKNGKRAETEKAKRELENAPIIKAIQDFATEKGSFVIASEIAEKCGISTSKASAMAKKLVESGFFKVEDTKIKGKGTVKAYHLA